MRHRTAVLTAAALVAGVAVPALAVNVVGTNGNDSLRGSPSTDRINGRGGNDRILGLAGNDTLIGGPGRDYIDGGPGNDTLLVRDGTRDTATCGAGRDRVTADLSDVVRANCETVLRPRPPSPPAPPPPPLAPGTTRSNPIPLGQAGNVGNGWTVTVTNVYPDATAQVLAANPSNGPPAAGNQYFMIAVTATYTGAGSSRLNSGFAMKAIGASNVAYASFEDACLLPEPSLSLHNPEVPSGGTISGNAKCWQIRSSDAGSLVMFYDLGDRTWFALH